MGYKILWLGVNHRLRSFIGPRRRRTLHHDASGCACWDFARSFASVGSYRLVFQAGGFDHRRVCEPCVGDTRTSVFVACGLCFFVLTSAKSQPGVVLHALVGPDRAERYCHSTAGALVLPKDRTFVGGATTLLALGLPLALHAVCAASVPCTLQQNPTLPDDMQFGVNMSWFSEDKLGNDSSKKTLDELFLRTWASWSSLTYCDFVVGCGVVIVFLLPLWLWLRNISHFVLEIWKLRSDGVDKRNIDRNNRESDTAEQKGLEKERQQPYLTSWPWPVQLWYQRPRHPTLMKTITCPTCAMSQSRNEKEMRWSRWKIQWISFKVKRRPTRWMSNLWQQKRASQTRCKKLRDPWKASKLRWKMMLMKFYGPYTL